MKIFPPREQYKGYNIYSMKKYVDRKRIIFTIAVGILVIITLALILHYSINTITTLQSAKEYQKQLISYTKEQEKKQEEEQAKIAAEQERIREQRLPKFTEQGKENIKHIYRSDTKRAFLTFDDGPSINTEQILNLLKEQNVKATFFVLGSNVETKPEMVRRMYKEGHFIANHGYSHVYSSIYSSPETVLNEYNQCNETVKKALNEPEYNSHVFRFPGGLAGGKYAELKAQANQILEQNDIVSVDWNCLSGDSEVNNASPEYLMARIQETSQGKNSLVILMHDAAAKKTTAETLPQIIQYLKEQGYEFKNLYDVLNI